MIITIAYTGMRWSEAIGLRADCVHDDLIDIDWKLYELNGRFYSGRPKDGSMRPADLPPFLGTLITDHIAESVNLTCTCHNAESPWCQGGKYVFLGPDRGHFRRSNYSERFMRPATDGRSLPRGGKNPRPASPVLVDAGGTFPGRPVPPWPLARAGETFTPPSGRGYTRYLSDEHVGRCQICSRAWARRQAGTLISDLARRERCPGAGQQPAPDVVLASWRQVLPGLTPHGLRHGLQTWMDEDGLPEVLKTERMGHELPGMHGVYGHVSPGMRAAFKDALQERWDNAIRQRATISPHSVVSVLDQLLQGAGQIA